MGVVMTFQISAHDLGQIELKVRAGFAHGQTGQDHLHDVLIIDIIHSLVSK